MFTFIAIFATLQAHAGPSEDASVLLSRFPAGEVPALPSVMSAIATLSNSGKDEHLPLLRALVSDESGQVARAASLAVASITGEHTVADTTPAEPEPAKTDEKEAAASVAAVR